MENIRLNTTFIVLLAITLVLFTIYFILFSIQAEVKDYGGLKEITGKVQSFEVSHGEADFYHFYQPAKRNTERYDDKLYGYKAHIQERRDETFFR